MKNNSKDVSVVGLGKLGQCLAVTLAYRGFRTLGIDLNHNIVEGLNQSKASVPEPGLQEMLDKSIDNFEATTDINCAIDKTDITFILLATPSDREGWFSNEYLSAALTSLSTRLKGSNKDYHLFVIASTVMPRSIEEVLIPIIENESGRELNQGFGVCHCPELVALGSVVKDFLEPGMIILGESDQKAGDIVEGIYKQWITNSATINRLNIINAELTKVSFNVFLTSKISFAKAFLF